MENSPKKRRKPYAWLVPTVLISLITVFLVGIAVINGSIDQVQADYVPHETGTLPSYTQAKEADLREKVLKVVHEREGTWKKYYWAIDQIQFSADQHKALIWLAPINKETSAVIGTEPRRVLAFNSWLVQSHWYILLEGDPLFQEVLEKSSLRFLDEVMQNSLPEDIKNINTGTVYGGYYLPWQAGLTKRLTWSVSHTSCNPIIACRYAFDYADGTMFPLKAAKAGYVYRWKDTCANGDSSCTNSITIQDRTTTPWTYQIYLHIANNSVPPQLKQIGAPVLQGQQIALVDDTGASSAHHVHFMVVGQNTLYCPTNGYCFGYSVDITYKDVAINWDSATQGGRPRLPEETDEFGGQGQVYYTSGNLYDPFPEEFYIPVILK